MRKDLLRNAHVDGLLRNPHVGKFVDRVAGKVGIDPAKIPGHSAATGSSVEKDRDPKSEGPISQSEVMNYVQILLYGLDHVAKRGEPGSITTTGSRSFCIVPNYEDRCVVGGTEYEKGRVVALAHNSMATEVRPCSSKSCPDDQIAINTLNRNIAAWVGHTECRYLEDENGGCKECPSYIFTFKNNECKQPMKIGGLGMSDTKLKEYVEGINELTPNLAVSGTSSNNNKVDSITRVINSNPDIIIWTNANSVEESVDPTILDERANLLAQFVKTGGGLITAVCPWGWESLAKGKATVQNGMLFNQALGQTGLLFNSNMAGTGNGGNFYDTKLAIEKSKEPLPITKLISTTKQLLTRSGKISTQDLVSSLQYYQDLPASAFRTIQSPNQEGSTTAALQAVEQLAKSIGAQTCKFPLDISLQDSETSTDKAAAILFILWLRARASNSPPQQLQDLIAPAIPDFPGTLTITAARAQNFLVSINPFLAKWQSTGIYLPPGEILEIELSDQALQAYTDLRLEVRVGCHSDTLQTRVTNKKYTLARHAQISTTRRWNPSVIGVSDNQPFSELSNPAKESKITVGSAYGGPLYIELLNPFSGDKVVSVPIVFKLNGGVAMPYVNVQREKNEVPWSQYTDSYPYTQYNWYQKLQNFGAAPWGEIEGRYIIMTVPTDRLKKLDNPVRAIEFWDTVITHYLALSGQSLNRKERIVADRQISNGWLHSGYPIMAHMDIYSGESAPAVLNYDQLIQDPSWGLYHELGHNRQNQVWTWSNGIEVTVNIFSLYATQMMNGLSPYQSIYFTKNCRKEIIEFLKDTNSNAETWKKEWNTALSTYVVFIEEFGWSAVSAVFKKYIVDRPNPKTDDEKLIEWARQTSLVTGVDLRPFYNQFRWGTFLNSAKLSELDNLPKYNKNVLDLIERNSVGA